MRLQVVQLFRQNFEYGSKELIHYFPGHMSRGMRQMQRTLKNVDCIVEVHDARIPFSGRNPVFSDTANMRPHILVLNKTDLADLCYKKEVAIKLEEEGISNVVYTNCKEQTNHYIQRKFLPQVIEMMGSGPRYHRSRVDDYNLLVIGVPNVGKSSFINAVRRTHLKKGKVARTGGAPGVTRSVEEKISVSLEPKIYIYDSPGILSHNIENMEDGMKLAACATLKDHLVGEDIIADYILYWLNKHEKFDYVYHFHMDEPVDNVYELLYHIAKSNGFYQRIKGRKGTGDEYQSRPNMTKAALHFLQSFREGLLGKVNLDESLVKLSV